MRDAVSSPITGAILTGGDSTRMGRDKIGVMLAGRTLLEHVHGIVAPICRDVMVVTREDRLEATRSTAPDSCRVVADRMAGRGPLVGIHAAIAAAATERVLVVACDMPWLQPALLEAMIVTGCGDVVIPRTERGWEPLHAVYDRRCLAAIEQRLEQGPGPVPSFFGAVVVDEWTDERCRLYDPDGRSFRNVNDPGDLRA